MASWTRGGWVLVLVLMTGCKGCKEDEDQGNTNGPLEAPLGAMYFSPWWAMHSLSTNCKGRTDAPCAYADLGLPFVKLENIRWQYAESKPPVDGVHRYDWAPLDDAVLRWEQAGARRLQFHLTPVSSWGMRDSRPIAEEVFGLDCDQLGSACDDLPTNPTEAHWQDWEAFVTALCERYDGDGEGDIEGLQHAHLDFELLNEGQNWLFYMGSSEDYQELLVHTRDALDDCNEDARIIHYGVTFNGLMQGGADDALYWERCDEKAQHLDPELVAPGYHHGHAMMLGSPDPEATVDAPPTLSMCEHFEVVDLHCNMSIGHMIEEHDFLRDKLDAWGCSDVEIICGDSTSAPALYSTHELEWWDSAYGGADTTGEALHLSLAQPWTTYGLLCNHGGVTPAVDYDVARAWYDHYQAAFAVKKASTALALGMTGFMAGLLEDWSPASGCYWMYQGLTDSYVEALGLVPVDYGEPRPVYHAYRLLGEKLGAYDSATREVVDEVTLLTFERGDQGPLTIAWYLDDHMPPPGEAEQTRSFQLEVDAPRVRVTRLMTVMGVDTPTTETVEIPDGVYTGSVGQTPVFIEPEE